MWSGGSREGFTGAAEVDAEKRRGGRESLGESREDWGGREDLLAGVLCFIPGLLCGS